MTVGGESDRSGAVLASPAEVRAWPPRGGEDDGEGNASGPMRRARPDRPSPSQTAVTPTQSSATARRRHLGGRGHEDDGKTVDVRLDENTSSSSWMPKRGRVRTGASGQREAAGEIAGPHCRARDDAAGFPRRAPRREVSRHDAAGAETVFSPDRHAGQTIAPPPSQTPSPIVIGAADSQPGAGVGFEGMRRGQELDARRDLDLVADRHGRAVEEDGAVVDEAARADADRVAVVALEGRHDLRALADAAEWLAKQRAELLPSVTLVALKRSTSRRA